MAFLLARPLERDVSTLGVTGQDPVASRLALVACWVAVLVRVVLVIGVIAIPVAFASYAIWEYIYLTVLGAFVVLMGAYIGLAFTLRCPHCRRRFLVESRGGRHPAARKAEHLGYWGTLVRDTIRDHQFTCMHCGALCRVRGARENRHPGGRADQARP